VASRSSPDGRTIDKTCHSSKRQVRRISPAADQTRADVGLALVSAFVAFCRHRRMANNATISIARRPRFPCVVSIVIRMIAFLVRYTSRVNRTFFATRGWREIGE